MQVLCRSQYKKGKRPIQCPVSPQAPDDEGDAPGADDPVDGVEASDDEGDAENVPNEAQENDDAELHQVCAI